ncbi:MAG TPA: hypothetical protein VFQ67_16235 [Allosphingosinicella sp.]|jgi:hypothetical protein|nr:hypothetical protein [Allosphingosinicella sp.]
MRILSNGLNALLLIAGLALAGLPEPAGARPAPAAAAPADPAAQAAKRCRSSDQAKEQTCYTAALDARLAEAGPPAALQLLDRLAALDPDVRRDGHMYAHRIGIAALKSPSEVGRVFATCTPGYQSGCYHGVIQSYFLAMQRTGAGITTQSVDAVCADHRETRRDLLFQCTHGLGHGLAILRSHDLPEALAACDLLSREDEREMCYAGGFMESLVNATHPDHIAVPATKAAAHGTAKAARPAPAGHDHHGDHGAADAAASAKPPFRALDPTDLHYPCSVLAEKYLVACYTIQTSAMLHHTKQDVARTAAECGRAPEKARTACFVSLGRDVSTIARGNNAEAVRLCGLAEAAFRPTCNRGVVGSIVNMNADPSEGIPYCKAVPEAESKRACYASVGLQALVLPEGEARREQACRAAEPDMLEACLGRPPRAEPPAGGL